MDPIANEYTIIKNHELLETNLEQEMVMMSVSAGKYYSLNQTAAKIWQLIDDFPNSKNLLAQLQSLYKVEPERLKLELIRILNQFESQKMIKFGVAQSPDQS